MKNSSSRVVGMVFVFALSLIPGSAWAGKQGTCNSEGGNPMCPIGEPGCEGEENGSAGGPGAAACEYGPGGLGSDVLHCMFGHYQAQGFNGEDVNFEIQAAGAPYIQVYKPGNAEPDSLCYREDNQLTAHTWVEIDSAGLVGKIRKPTQRPSGLYGLSGPPKIRIDVKNLGPAGAEAVIEVPTTGVASVAALNRLLLSGLERALGEDNVDETKEFFIILGLDVQDLDVHHLSFYSSDSGITLSEIELGNNGTWNATNCTPAPRPR